MDAVIGWDIGGAHVKAARILEGRVAAAVQVACPLWLGLDRLPTALAEVSARLGPARLHAATMTGELADAFASRAAGVTHIAATLTETVAPARVLIYGGPAGFLDASNAANHTARVASANWHATATLAGLELPEALLVDMGSTTTDLIPIRDGAPHAAGYTDAERLASGELVYTGLVRTALMSLADRAPFAGVWSPLAHEYFATAADVYRLLGELDEAADQMATADAREKSQPSSRARLARMLGRDASDGDAAAWRQLAAWFAEAQLRSITDGAMLALSRAMLPETAPIVGAGCGRHVTRRLAARLDRPWQDFAALPAFAAVAPADADQCAPAAAVGLLAAHRA